MGGVIRSLLDPDDEDEDGSKTNSKSRDRISQKYVIVVDHDLSVLDYVSDNICCLYGSAAAFGCVSKPYGVGQGINNFLAGYLPSENVRFRDHALKFKNSAALADGIQAAADDKEDGSN